MADEWDKYIVTPPTKDVPKEASKEAPKDVPKDEWSKFAVSVDGEPVKKKSTAKSTAKFPGETAGDIYQESGTGSSNLPSNDGIVKKHYVDPLSNTPPESLTTAKQDAYSGYSGMKPNLEADKAINKVAEDRLLENTFLKGNVPTKEQLNPTVAIAKEKGLLEKSNPELHKKIKAGIPKEDIQKGLESLKSFMPEGLSEEDQGKWVVKQDFKEKLEDVPKEKVGNGFWENVAHGIDNNQKAREDADMIISDSKASIIEDLEQRVKDYQPDGETDLLSKKFFGQTLGGMGEDVILGIGASFFGTPIAGITTVTAKQAAQQAGSEFVDGYIQARLEGKSEDEAYSIATGKGWMGAATGAAEGAAIIFTGAAGKVGNGIKNKIVQQFVKKSLDSAADAGVAVAMQGIRNLNDQRLGLKRDLTEGMAENAFGEVLGGGIPNIVSGVQDYKQSKANEKPVPETKGAPTVDGSENKNNQPPITPEEANNTLKGVNQDQGQGTGDGVTHTINIPDVGDVPVTISNINQETNEASIEGVMPDGTPLQQVVSLDQLIPIKNEQPGSATSINPDVIPPILPISGDKGNGGLSEVGTANVDSENTGGVQGVEEDQDSGFTDEQKQEAYDERGKELKKLSGTGYKEQFIHDNLGRITEADLAHYGDPPTPPKPPIANGEGKPEGRKSKPKSLFKRLIKDSVPTDAMKALIEAEGLDYDVMSNEMSDEVADKLLDAVGKNFEGLSAAFEMVQDMGIKFGRGSRFGLALKVKEIARSLAAKAKADGDMDAHEEYTKLELEIYKFLDVTGREFGTEIQKLRNLYNSSPEVIALYEVEKLNASNNKKLTAKSGTEKTPQQRISEQKKANDEAIKKGAEGVNESEALKKAEESITKKKNPKSDFSKAKIQEKKDEAAKKLKDLFSGNITSGVDPVLASKIVIQGTKYGYYTIIEGAHDFASWSKKMKADLGAAIEPYLDRIWNGKHKGVVLDDFAGAVRKTSLDGVSKDVWDSYRQEAVEKLTAALTPTKGGKGLKPALQEFSTRLVNNIKKGNVTPAVKNMVSQESIIKEALANIDEYRQVVQETMEQMENSGVDLGDITELPFFTNAVRLASKKALKDLGKKIRQTVTEHYTKVDELGRDLEQKLIDNTGLTEEEAKMDLLYQYYDGGQRG